MCDLYDARPMTCRTFGPPVRSAAARSCELCFHGATDEQIAACEMVVDPENVESSCSGNWRRCKVRRADDRCVLREVKGGVAAYYRPKRVARDDNPFPWIEFADRMSAATRYIVRGLLILT